MPIHPHGLNERFSFIWSLYSFCFCLAKAVTSHLIFTPLFMFIHLPLIHFAPPLRLLIDLFLHLIMHFVIVSLTWLAYFLSHDYLSCINSLGFLFISSLFSVSLWRRVNALNVRLYYPYWQYTDLFIFRFVSLLCLRSTLRCIFDQNSIFVWSLRRFWLKSLELKLNLTFGVELEIETRFEVELEIERVRLNYSHVRCTNDKLVSHF